jgi:capsular polysaccharide biosynthesis protein
MAGRTGKLTNEALAARGPRMVLARIEHQNGRESYVIHLERENCLRYHGGSASPATLKPVAKSFTLSYLLKIGKTMMEVL